LIKANYGSEIKWQSVNVHTMKTSAKRQFSKIIKAEKAQQRNIFLAGLFIMLFIASMVYFISGPVGLFVIVIFAFYYHEKNKLNTWSDVTE
jgi:hypothetical protein